MAGDSAAGPAAWLAADAFCAEAPRAGDSAAGAAASPAAVAELLLDGPRAASDEVDPVEYPEIAEAGEPVAGASTEAAWLPTLAPGLEA